jgi:hypothetical protein
LIGIYPGTFNPPTVAHLAVAEAAWRQGGLGRLDLVVSLSPLGKSDPGGVGPALPDRLAVLEAIASSRPWLAVRTSESQLIAELAAGYDAVVVGADKWGQVVDPAWYGGSVAARDAAVALLPRVLVAPRHGHPVALEGLPAGALLLDVDDSHSTTSSSAVRAGRVELMVPEAAEFDRRTGAWSDPCRYRRQHGD